MAAKKRIGRPPKSQEDRKGVNFTFRSRGQMRERLQEAATVSGRSISEEIEHRLEDSFRNEEIYGGPHLSAVFRLLADHKALAEAKAGKPWTESDFVQDEIAKAFAQLIAKEIPGFYSVNIETLGKNREIRGVRAFASEEVAEKESPGLAESLRRAREAIASQSTDTERGGSK
jgi:hypothetical protein